MEIFIINLLGFITALIPVIFFFAIMRIIMPVLRDILKGPRRRERRSEPYGETEREEEESVDVRQEPPPVENGGDLRRMMQRIEERLKKEREAAEKQEKYGRTYSEPEDEETVRPQQEAEGRVYSEQQPGARPVHSDGCAIEHEKPRIHREGEKLQHDKGRVYYDPSGDYSYDEEKMNAEAEAFREKYLQSEPERRKPKIKMKRSALVDGFIMSQVLDKPRSLKPYGQEPGL